jgi:tripartite-type tricarboxylate transporter receptor subunit TctC
VDASLFQLQAAARLPGKLPRRRFLHLAAGAAAFTSAIFVTLIGQSALSQTRTIKFVVPFPAGGSMDILARLIGEQITKTRGIGTLGHPSQQVNRVAPERHVMM